MSEDGEVLYVFPKDYRTKLAGKSFRMKVEPLVNKAKVFGVRGGVNVAFDYLEFFWSWFVVVLVYTFQEAGAYLVRVSFGTALIASIVLVYTTIIAILSSSRYVCYSGWSLCVLIICMFTDWMPNYPAQCLHPPYIVQFPEVSILWMSYWSITKLLAENEE